MSLPKNQTVKFARFVAFISLKLPPTSSHNYIVLRPFFRITYVYDEKTEHMINIMIIIIIIVIIITYNNSNNDDDDNDL